MATRLRSDLLPTGLKACLQRMSDAPRKSGAPGRPSSMDLVLEEFKRRRESGKLEPTKQAMAESLCNWLNQTHLHEAKLTAKTIKNKLPPSLWPLRGPK